MNNYTTNVASVETITGIKHNDYWRLAYLVISILVIGALSSSSSSIVSIVSFVLMLTGIIVDTSIPFCIYLTCNVLNVSFMTSLTSLGSLSILLGLSFYLLAKSNLSNNKNTKFVTFLFFSLLLSYLFGPNSSFIKFLSIVLTLLIFFSFGTFYSKGKEDFIIISLITVGLYVGISTWLGFRAGTAEMLNDVKLSYHENIRTLANACAFPFVYSSCMLIHSITNNTLFKKWWLIVFSLLFGFLLINSYSRGALIASISAVGVYTFMVNKKTKFSNRILIFILLAGFALLATRVDIASATMYNDSSMLARSDLWTYLFAETLKNPLTVMFGLGTGDIREFLRGSSFEGYYTHSLILDYYFCYGLVGFFLFMKILYQIISKLIKNKQYFMIAVFVLSVLMFFSHGMSTSILFYGLMGLCLGRIYS